MGVKWIIFSKIGEVLVGDSGLATGFFIYQNLSLKRSLPSEFKLGDRSSSRVYKYTSYLSCKASLEKARSSVGVNKHFHLLDMTNFIKQIMNLHGKVCKSIPIPEMTTILHTLRQ